MQRTEPRNCDSGISRRVAIVGGGIAGLAAAHHLRELAPHAQITLFESASRLGGVLDTVHEDGFQIEQSADNFITTVPWGVELCRRLGLADQLVQTNPAYRRTLVVRRGRLCPLPDGFLMMAPSRLWPLALTPLLSPWGKLRAAWEYFVPRRADEADESLADFVCRRLGREVFERLVEPLLSAVYAADPQRLSLLATLPRFREMERHSGSLIRAMRRQMKTRTKSGRESGARYSMFVTLRDGLKSLVEALTACLPDDAVRLGAKVERIARDGDGWQLWLERDEEGREKGERSEVRGQWAEDVLPSPACGRGAGGEGGRNQPHATLTLTLSQRERGQKGWEAENQKSEIVNHKIPASHAPRPSPLSFDALILAVSSDEAARLLQPTDAALAAELASIQRTGTAIVSLGYESSQLGRQPNAMGAVVPAVEGGAILAVSFSSRKYPHRSPPGKELLRVFVGGARRPELCRWDDDQLLPPVIEELSRLLRISGQPCHCRVARWPGKMPQYHVGHLELVARIEARAAALGCLALAGNSYRGVGLPDCIHSGQLAAERILAIIQKGDKSNF
jgi:protoporphyrinogen oxidase